MRIKQKSKFPTESKLRLGNPHRVKFRGKLNMQMWRNWQTLRSQKPVKQFVRVQVPSSAPHSINPNLFLVGDGFGFIVFDEYFNFNAKS